MLSSRYKISSWNFKKKYNKGVRKSSNHFRFNVLEDKNLSSPCFAVIINKKLYKKAVQRNKQRRRIYNIISETYPQFCKGFWCFIFIQKDISALSYLELKKEINDVLLSF